MIKKVGNCFGFILQVLCLGRTLKYVLLCLGRTLKYVLLCLGRTLKYVLLLKNVVLDNLIYTLEY